jgi:two-component system, NtrC family, response regulator AtoC
MNKPRILIVEDDNDWQQIYESSLSKSAYEIIGTRKINEALALLQTENFDVVITDLKMLGGSEVFSGFGVLELAKSNNAEIQVIVITGFGSADHAMRAMGSGAYDYITKGPDLRKKLALTVKGALEINSLKQQLLKESLNDDVQLDANPIIGNSSNMRILFEQITQSSENEFNVLIQGESGTGKRLIAQTIHLRSARKNGPFLVVDCGRLSETVLEAELFGNEVGTIFRPTQGRAGKFEQAQDGTIFLDGFGNLAAHLQPRLIGVICDKQVERIGGKAPIAINARIIASTDKDLQTLSKAGRFERKLFDALDEYVITVPPLRKRKDGDDIPALAAMFLQRYSKDAQQSFSKDTIELLKNYDYPGNIRELESIVKHALSVSRGSTILPEHLRPELSRLSQPIDEEKGMLPSPIASAARQGETIYEPSVFVSYAWGDEREEIVNKIDKSLQQRGLRIIRDKRDLPYKGSIKEFMERIGQGDCVIVVISDKYLRSPNCMFELVEIAEKQDFRNRIFPVIWKDANIYDPLKRIEYIKHWEVTRANLAKAMKKLDPANLQGIREEMDLYDRIRDKISGLTSILKDMNTLTPEMHQESDFGELYNALEKRIRNSLV